MSTPDPQRPATPRDQPAFPLHREPKTLLFRLLALGLLLAVGAVIARQAWPYVTAWRAKEFLDSGVAAHRADKLDEAEILLRSALKLQPDLPAARIDLVQLLIDRGDFGAALEESGEVPELWGGSPPQFIFDSLLLRKDFIRLVS